MPERVDARLASRLRLLDAQGLTRYPPAISDRRGVRYRLAGRDVAGFCSNDYLGLADDPALRVSAPRSGASGSRLVCGDLPEHRALEDRLARLVDHESAILFPSGFQLNVGVLPALLDPDDYVSSDALNHASLIDGIRLSKAARTILPHGNAPAPAPGNAVHWWVCESVFSMDGDRIDLDRLHAHLRAGGAAFLDEAHALGLFPEGRGLASHHGVRPTVLVGTLSKAVGCAGAFVAGSRVLCDYLRARARSFVFSTGISPALVPRIDAALDILTSSEGDQRRKRLWENARSLADALGTDPPPSPIFPILVGANDRVVALADSLLDRGFHVQPIRPPTVPPGTARLRVTVSALHSPEQVAGLATALREAFAEHDLAPLVARGRVDPVSVTDTRAIGSAP